MRLAPSLCGAFSILVAVWVMAGRIFDIQAFQTALPGIVSMKPNTVLCFILAGAALLLLAPLPVSRPRLLTGRACALLILTVSGLTLAEYAFGWQLGLDEFFFTDAQATFRTAAPGRMTLPAALVFLLVALALFILEWEPRRFFRPAEWLAFLAFVITLSSLFQHFFASPLLDQQLGIFPIAPHAAPSFFALALGLFAARPDQGLLSALRAGTKSPLERRVYATVAISLLALVVVEIATLFSANESAARSRWVNHSYQVRETLGAIYSSLQEWETGQRGYALTGLDVFFEHYELARGEIEREYAALAALVADNPGQTERLAELERLAREKWEFGRKVVQTRRSNGLDAAAALVAAGEGKRTMEAIRGVLDEMAQEEERLLRDRQVEERSGVARLNAAIVISGIFALGILMYAARAIRNGFRLREQAEEALRASEENLSVTLRSIGDAVMTTDIAGRVTGLNAVAEKLTGWAEAEAEGHAVDEVFRIIDEGTRRPAIVPVERVLATGEIQGLANHTALISRNGTECLIADSAAPIRDAQGQVRGVVLVFRDVTAERQAAAERDRFFSLSLDMLCIAKSDGYFKRVNPSFTQALGWSEEELLTRPFLEFVHPDDRAATLLEVEKQVKRGEIVLAFENRYRHKDGSWRLLSWTSVPHTDGIMYGAARDVTEARAAEVELRRSRAVLENLFKSLPGLYLVLTPALRIIAASDAYLAATMTKREDVLDRGIFEVFPDDPGDPQATGVSNLRASFERVRQTAAADTMAIQKYDIRRPDGAFEARYWSPINSPVLGVDRRIEYIIHRVEDVTEFMRQKSQPIGDTPGSRARMEQMEAEIFRNSQDLEAANRQLVAANAEIESFSYSVSHDLRAPLRHIQGYGEMLAKAAQGQLSDKAERYLKIIVDTGYEMGSLIDELLAFSRIGRVEMREEKVSLDRLVEETIQGSEMATRGRNIVWKVPPLPPVLGDRSMIKQVFANLIGNALKYSNMRDPSEIEVGRDGSEAERVVLFVRDNGVGFDMQYADKLFGVFQRLHRAEEFEGTGIGLANARRIVVRHGGRIWAEAELNKGATFYFTLKLSLAE